MVRAVPVRDAVVDGFGNSLTIENASSTDYTLTIMTGPHSSSFRSCCVYQAWTYWVFRKRVSRSRIEGPSRPQRIERASLVLE